MEQDDSILRYYEAEMRYLREAGKEFARAHPDRARMLNLDRVGIAIRPSNGFTKASHS